MIRCHQKSRKTEKLHNVICASGLHRATRKIIVDSQCYWKSIDFFSISQFAFNLWLSFEQLKKLASKNNAAIPSSENCFSPKPDRYKLSELNYATAAAQLHFFSSVHRAVALFYCATRMKKLLFCLNKDDDCQ